MDPGDALASMIEASMALAGFSGIVVVLGRRGQGEWQPQEDLRLVNLLANSLTALLAALLGVLLLTTRLAPSIAWLVCSAVWLVAAGLHSAWIVGRSRALREQALRRTNPLFFWFGSALSAVALALQLVNIAWLREFWPFFAGLLTSLALGARQFVVLLRAGPLAGRG